MKKAQFDIPAFTKNQNKTQTVLLVEQLKKDEHILNFIKRNNCSIDLVEKYPIKFNKWLDVKMKCENCPSLNSCVQPVKGQFQDLEWNGLLTPVIRTCRYQVTQNKEVAHMVNYLVCDMPKHFYNLKIEDIQIRGESKDYFDALLKVVDWLKNPKERGLYLYGSVGVGKTYIAACAANYFARKGKKVAFIQVPDWISRMKNCFDADDTFTKEISKVKRADFVVFDDIGAESVTPWVRDELLFPILNKRMEEKKMTWFTSNEDFVSLENHFRNTKQNDQEEMKAVRILERVKALSNEFQIPGKNRRNQG
ncbi:ATP-binding protein [Anaerorhabdus sp.]|jgi:primosomal protein DnaI|uniref:ATP-binding protein n=1 Tax=Anaerorhabdus sp. TaxID=1872524 RepID=UPI002FC64ADD